MLLHIKHCLIGTLSLLMVACCSNASKSVELLRFERMGGGEIEYSVFSKGSNSIEIRLKTKDFQPNDTIFVIVESDETAELFHTLRTLDNYKKNNEQAGNNVSKLCTGTWTKFYITTNSVECTVTDPLLLKNLEPLENLIREQFK